VSVRFANKIGLLFLSFFLLSEPVAAANFVCVARPADYLSIGGNGTVYTQVDGIGISGICNVNTTTGVVTAQSCIAWYSALLTQRASGRTISLQYDDPAAAGCSSYSAWDVKPPYFFILNVTP
jgi:hypothetical protein